MIAVCNLCIAVYRLRSLVDDDVIVVDQELAKTSFIFGEDTGDLICRTLTLDKCTTCLTSWMELIECHIYDHDSRYIICE